MTIAPETYVPDPARFALSAYLRTQRECPVILVVEDEKFSRTLLLEMLGHEFEIHTAHNGLEALQLYEHIAPDLVFLDIDIPLLDGLTVLSYITSFDNEACVIMVTGSDSAADRELATTCGAKEYITKPYTRTTIEGCLHDIETQRLLAH